MHVPRVLHTDLHCSASCMYHSQRFENGCAVRVWKMSMLDWLADLPFSPRGYSQSGIPGAESLPMAMQGDKVTLEGIRDADSGWMSALFKVCVACSINGVHITNVALHDSGQRAVREAYICICISLTSIPAILAC